MALLAEGFIRYPDELPCPQVDTDLTPRERRYISDIGEVKRLRRFQSTFQAERKNISFIFTRAQAKLFREWYKEEIIEGGAWFYADWPILHKEKKVSYRFVTRPVWEFLARGVYHVSATVETYERKIGRAANVYTSKIYPYYFNDSVTYSGMSMRAMPNVKTNDKATYNGASIDSGTARGYIYTTYPMTPEKATYQGVSIESGSYTKWIYSSYTLESERVSYAGMSIERCEITAKLIAYTYFPKADNSASYSGIAIESGEIA